MKGVESDILVWWARNESGPSAREMLNRWLEDNSEKEIVQITQSEAGDTMASRRITYTIFYKKDRG